MLQVEDFRVGDRVYIKDEAPLIPRVRGQYGYVIKINQPYRTLAPGRARLIEGSLNIQLDNGARPGVGSEFYGFNFKYVELVTPREPDWEI